MKILKILLTATLISVFSSCDESSNIGNSIIQDNVTIVKDSSFTVAGQSIANPSVQSRTITQMLGKINAKGYGSIKSDIVTQFMPANSLDTTGVTVESIDSLKLIMLMYNGRYIGDSIVPMGLDVYKLDKALPSPIYSDFDPQGYYSESSKIASAIYTANVLGYSDSIVEAKYSDSRIIEIKLPTEMGREFFQKYKDSPETYSNPISFTKWFPGLYIRNSFGSGRIMRFDYTRLYLYYSKTVPSESTGRDTTYQAASIFLAASPVVISNNNISLDLSTSITELADREPIVVAPTGYDIEFTFPIDKIIDRYTENSNKLSVINNLSFEIPAEKIANDYGITPPTYLLLVQKSKKDEFFNKKQLCDSKTSFYATYNSTTGSYKFSEMRQYLIEMLSRDEITAEDMEFILTPVDVEMETSSSSSYYYSSSTSYVSAIVPYISTPAMAKLNFNDAKIKLTYSQQTTNF